jgi:hypothetical protein
MTDELHPQVVRLLKQYSSALAKSEPSTDLRDRIANIEVAAPRASVRANRPIAWQRWAMAACVPLLAIGIGIAIGMRIDDDGERAAALPAESVTDASSALLGPSDGSRRWAQWEFADPVMSMWSAEPIVLRVPAEVSETGTLIAVDEEDASRGSRYWVDVVVSSDGFMHIKRIVPAESS